jgi:glycosyltransferase involved in cell wall biosynthesis
VVDFAMPPAAGGGEALRVLHIVSSDAFAGVERHVLRLTGELRALGCAAELACPPSAARMRTEAGAKQITVHPSRTLLARAWLGAVARDVRRQPPHAIHLHDGRSAVAGALLAPLARGLVIRTQHFTRPASVERPGWRKPASIALHRALNRTLDGYIAVSQSVANEARARHETGNAEVVVIPPGIQLPGTELVVQARAAREESREPVVTYIGRLEAEKRVDVLLEAIPRVRDQLPECRFVIAGSGGAEKELRQLAGRLGIDAAITWAGWVAEPDAVLKDAHVYVNPEPWEGFGMAMAEAMAFGLPVVAVNSGASAEMVEDGITGFLVSSGDSAALATAIGSLAGDRRQAAEMGEVARQRAVRRYGVERTARATLAFYQRLREEACP